MLRLNEGQDLCLCAWSEARAPFSPILLPPYPPPLKDGPSVTLLPAPLTPHLFFLSLLFPLSSFLLIPFPISSVPPPSSLHSSVHLFIHSFIKSGKKDYLER